ncbi:MAG: inositol monophosphatase [Pseudobdellovibrionaceae bacterium]
MALRSPDLNVMIKAAEAASKSLLRDFGEVEQLQVSRKGPADFVSAADRRAEQILHRELSKARPSYSFLMEESGAIKGEDPENIFIIDPLDGTTNFLHGIPQWCISIALERKGEIVAGLIYDPVQDEMFTAEKGTGAFMRNRRMRVSGRTKLEGALVMGGSPVSARSWHKRYMGQLSQVLDTDISFRRMGSAALDLAYVACGRADAFWEEGLNAWDVAAGALIVKEAGGTIVSTDKSETDPVRSGALIASNTHIHPLIEKLVDYKA